MTQRVETKRLGYAGEVTGGAMTQRIVASIRVETKRFGYGGDGRYVGTADLYQPTVLNADLTPARGPTRAEPVRVYFSLRALPDGYLRPDPFKGVTLEDVDAHCAETTHAERYGARLLAAIAGALDSYALAYELPQ